jgi:hypothetical protein
MRDNFVAILLLGAFGLMVFGLYVIGAGTISIISSILSSPDASMSTSDEIATRWAAVGGATLLFLIYFAIRFLLGEREFEGSRVLVPLLIVAFAVATSAATVRTITTSGVRDQARQQASAFAPACEETPRSVAGASAYGGSTHPLVVVGPGGTANQSTAHAIDLGLTPASSDQIQLVVCSGPDVKKVVDTCSYSGGSTVTVWQHSLDIRLVEGATGRQLDEQTFSGSKQGCPGSVSGNAGQNHDQDDGMDWNRAGVWTYVSGWATGPLGSGSSNNP